MGFNLATMLEEVAARDPERPLAFVHDETLSFGEVDVRARRVAAGLLARGLAPGARVVVQLPNVPEFIVAYFGILKAGLTMVPVNPLLAGPEIAYVLGDSEARLLVTHGSSLASARAGTDGFGDVEVLVVDGADVAVRDDFASLERFEPLEHSAATEPQDTAVVLYTSGTTGRPKGAELTHVQLFMNCTVTGELIAPADGDVMTAVLPLFHVFGLSSVLNIAVRFGVPLVLLRRFDVTELLDALERHRVTIFSGVPTMYVTLLQADVAGRDLSSLRRGLSGGASMPAEVIRGVEEKFPGLVVLEGYGLSETASVASFNIDARNRRVSSIGKPIWGIEMRVVDPHGAALPPGEEHVGEIVIRGHNVMSGYLGRPDATAEAVRDGWFHTGDLGRTDEDGYFYVVDRLKDLIIRGGYNVYPREVEEILFEHPGVVEAAVVGVPDDRLGEEVAAYVVVRPGVTVEMLDAHCRERVAAYKYPRRFTLLDSLPKGPTGKLLKRELKS